MEVINLKEKGSQIPNLYQYEVIAKMNHHNFTLVRVKDRTLDFHTHPDSDEAFFIVEGKMKLEFRNKTIELSAGEMCVVAKGTEHRPICTTEVICLLIENEGTLTPENTGEAKEMTRIRPAHMQELDVLHGIVRDATRHMDEQDIPQWDEIYPNKLILKDDIEKQQIHVIENEGRVAGLIVINEDQPPEYGDVPWKYSGRVLVIHRLTIDPTYQRRGLATSLMDFAEEIAATHKYDSIRLDAFTRNPAAFTLYENRGYRRAGMVRFRKGEFFCYEKKISAETAIKSSNKSAHRIADKRKSKGLQG